MNWTDKMSKFLHPVKQKSISRVIMAVGSSYPLFPRWPVRWIPVVESCDFDPYAVRRMRGGDVTLEWARRDGLFDPVLVPDKAGLGLEVPPPSFSVHDVAAALGSGHAVNVMDVASQGELAGWTLGRWCDYVEAPPERRRELHPGGPLNVISLEFSGTALASRVRGPALVRALDWVDNSWPAALRAQVWCAPCAAAAAAAAFLGLLAPVRRPPPHTHSP